MLKYDGDSFCDCMQYGICKCNTSASERLRKKQFDGQEVYIISNDNLYLTFDETKQPHCLTLSHEVSTKAIFIFEEHRTMLDDISGIGKKSKEASWHVALRNLYSWKYLCTDQPTGNLKLKLVNKWDLYSREEFNFKWIVQRKPKDPVFDRGFVCCIKSELNARWLCSVVYEVASASSTNAGSKTAVGVGNMAATGGAPTVTLLHHKEASSKNKKWRIQIADNRVYIRSARLNNVSVSSVILPL